MAFRISNRMRWARMVPALCVGLLLVLAFAFGQQQVSGRVINRSGYPCRGCQVEFYFNPNERPVQGDTTNNDGYFYLRDPRHGNFKVSVRQGQQQLWIDVTIDYGGLHPSTLVVGW